MISRTVDIATPGDIAWIDGGDLAFSLATIMATDSARNEMCVRATDGRLHIISCLIVGGLADNMEQAKALVSGGN